MIANGEVISVFPDDNEIDIPAFLLRSAQVTGRIRHLHPEIKQHEDSLFMPDRWIVATIEPRDGVGEYFSDDRPIERTIRSARYLHMAYRRWIRGHEQSTFQGKATTGERGPINRDLRKPTCTGEEVVNSNRPFRFGVTTANADSANDWTEKVRKIEALGYSTVTIPDHFPDRLAAVPALMAAAAATSTLRLGSWVFCNDFRHPAMVYKEAATIDLLSGGRFELGIGAGWLKAEYDMTGIPFDPPGTRVARMEEAIRIIKGLAGDDPLDFQGDHYRISGLTGAPKPVQQPLPPLYIGGGGKQLLTFAAQEADIVGFGARALPGGGLDTADISAAALQRKVSWVNRAAQDAGTDPERNLLVFLFELTDDRHAAGKLAEHLPGMTEDDILASPHILLGSLDEMTDQVRRTREVFGISYFVLNTGNADQIEPFSGIVKHLAGR